jgi:predicted metal-dependent hydrolase
MRVTKQAVAAEIRTTTQERGEFTYGSDAIQYDVIRKTKPTDKAKKSSRKIIIKVHPDQRVVATVPHDADEDAIQAAMQKRARWVWQNIHEFAKQKETVLDKHYESGETQFYLGKRYVLKIIVDNEQRANVKLSRGKLQVTLRHELPVENNERTTKVKALLNTWYQEKARCIFQERLTELLPKTTWVTGIPSFRVMTMKTQWGSCSTKGNLMLNPHLVKASKECIDYVILHELCHIAEHNHSERFWRLLTQVMPNWKEVKAKLDDMAEMYLNS